MSKQNDTQTKDKRPTIKVLQSMPEGAGEKGHLIRTDKEILAYVRSKGPQSKKMLAPWLSDPEKPILGTVFINKVMARVMGTTVLVKRIYQGRNWYYVPKGK